MAFFKAAVTMALVSMILIPLLPKLVDVVFDRLIFLPRDLSIGVVRRSQSQLRFYADKTMLVVGGTSGIGRGIAIAAADAGATVHIVGRNEAAGHSTISMGVSQFHRQDLSTVRGCQRLVRELSALNTTFDLLVMTVGVWPDLSSPLTQDGYEKTAFLDVIARFIVFHGLLKADMLSPDARVMNVLASAQPALPSFLLSIDQMKAKFAPVFASRSTESERRAARSSYTADLLFPRTLAAAGQAGDAFLWQAAHKQLPLHPRLRFVGTFPGLVATESTIARQTLGGAADYAMALASALGLTLTSGECALRHLHILASDQVRVTRLSFWDHFLQARETSVDVAQSSEFGPWLWQRLHDISEAA